MPFWAETAYATNVDYNVYFQRNTVLLVLFMFTVINFHISKMVGFFVIINFSDSLSFVIWAMARQNLQNHEYKN